MQINSNIMSYVFLAKIVIMLQTKIKMFLEIFPAEILNLLPVTSFKIFCLFILFNKPIKAKIKASL